MKFLYARTREGVFLTGLFFWIFFLYGFFREMKKDLSRARARQIQDQIFAVPSVTIPTKSLVGTHVEEGIYDYAVKLQFSPETKMEKVALLKSFNELTRVVESWSRESRA